MKLEKDFAREVKKLANGDGSRELKFDFLKKVREARKALSTAEVAKGKLAEVIKEYGRVPVAVCLAVTIWERRDRLSQGVTAWAGEVLALWTNRPADILSAYIDDGLHPTRIEEYAGSFIRLTTEGSGV